MRVYQILEAEPFDISKIAQSGPVTDTATGIKVTPQGDGKFKLEYPDGRVETAKNEKRKDRMVRDEKIRMNKLQKSQNKAQTIRNKTAQKQADKDLKALKGGSKVGKAVKGAFASLKKGTIPGIIGTFIMQAYNGGWDEWANHGATLAKQNCNARHEAVRKSRWGLSNQLAEMVIGIGAASMAAALMKLGAAGIAVFFTIPALGWIGGIISFVALSTVAYTVTKWLIDTPSGRQWLAEQVYGAVRDIEPAFCDALGFSESVIVDDEDFISEQVNNNEIKSDVKDVLKDLPKKLKADLAQGIKKSKQAAS